MAIYHLNASTGSRSGGQSATAKADYVARAGRYSKERDEVALIESANMPGWVKDGRGRAANAALDYWRQADKAERANGVLFRQVEFALPVELSKAERHALARQFADKLAAVDGGHLPYTLAVHEKPGNPHAHLVLSERINDGIERDRDQFFKRAAVKGRDPASGGARKADIASRRGDWLAETREQWADVANAALERHGVRIDHRSLVEQNIDRQPTEHLGPQPAAIEKRTGLRSERRRRLDVRSEIRKPVTTARCSPEKRHAAVLEIVCVPVVPAAPAHENALPMMIGGVWASPSRPREVAAAVLIELNQEQHRVTDQRRTRIIGELDAASRQLAGTDRSLRAGRDRLERTERPTLRADQLAQRREQASQRMGGASQPAGARVPQRGRSVGAAFDRLDSAARQRVEVRKQAMATKQDHELVAQATAKRSDNPSYSPTLDELKAVDAVLIEQARQRISPSEPVIQPPQAAPTPTLAERIAASLAVMVEWIKNAGGRLLDTKTGSGSMYAGPVKQADEHHAVHDQGRGVYVIHRQDDLAQRLEAADDVSVEVKYGRDGRGSVTVKARGGRGGRSG